jgi:hypothetical protein
MFGSADALKLADGASTKSMSLKGSSITPDKLLFKIIFLFFLFFIMTATP